MDSNLPKPVYQMGQAVEVIFNDRNHTLHRGTIRQIIWHHKMSCYHYYLEANGKKISKRYLAEDLQP